MTSDASGGPMKENFAAPVASSYFEHRDLGIGADEIVVVACMRNELQRLPYFLEYYRRLGVTRFLLVDNDSTDGTRGYLADQPDVEYFWTDGSYRGSSAGRLWLQEIADRHATGRWVITVDVDELLVFPGAEVLSLREFCAYLDDNDHAGLFTIMLDMYSDRPLSQTRYEPGTDFIDTCPYFETDSYWISPGENPPFLSVFGGPRDRLFRQRGERRGKPMMKKIPLVKWHEGFSYMYSTHSHRFIQLSDITGVLLHFKFFDTFERVASEDAERGDRRQQAHYTTYQETVEADVCFYSTRSCAYQGPAGLARMGVMRWSSRYQRFLESHLRAIEDNTDSAVLLPRPVAPEGSLTLRSVAAIWPLVNNPGIAHYFGVKTRPAREQRRALLDEMHRHVKVLDVHPDHLLIRLAEPSLHRWQRSRLGMAVYVGRHLVRAALVDGEDDAFTVDVSSLEPGVHRLAADVEGGARIAGAAPSAAPVTVYLIDGDDDPRLGGEVGADLTPRPEDTLIYARPWFADGGSTEPAHGFRGALDWMRDGQLRGWVYDAEQDTFDVAVCIYLDGRLARYVWPAQRRRDIDGLGKTGTAARGRGFLVDLPLGYAEGVGSGDTRIDVAVAGRNLALQRSPLELPVGVRDARWHQSSGTWHFGPEPGDGRAFPALAAVNGASATDRSPHNGTTSSPWWRVWSS